MPSPDVVTACSAQPAPDRAAGLPCSGVQNVHRLQPPGMTPPRRPVRGRFLQSGLVAPWNSAMPVPRGPDRQAPSAPPDAVPQQLENSGLRHRIREPSLLSGRRAVLGEVEVMGW